MNMLKRTGYVTFLALLIMVSCQSDEEVTKTVTKTPETSLITDITSELTDESEQSVVKGRSNPSAAQINQFFVVWMTVTKTSCDRYTIEANVDEVTRSNDRALIAVDARLLNHNGTVAINYGRLLTSTLRIAGRFLRKGISYDSNVSTNLRLQVRFYETGIANGYDTGWINAIDVATAKDFFTVRKTC